MLSVGVSDEVSTHSRPKAAGTMVMSIVTVMQVSTHSRPKAAGNADGGIPPDSLFQHTAARRRLAC